MIELTATHLKIIERQNEGWPDAKIRRFTGLYRDSDWLGVMQIIAAWRAQQPPEAKIAPPESVALSGLESQAWRAVCDSKRPVLACQVAVKIGLSAKDTLGLLVRLQRKNLVTFLKPTKRGEAGLWKAI